MNQYITYYSTREGNSTSGKEKNAVKSLLWGLFPWNISHETILLAYVNIRKRNEYTEIANYYMGVVF